MDELLGLEAIPEGHKSGFVSIVGRPNAGKSTLMNVLLREKIAIVTPRPQTTRLQQLGILSEEDYQIVFIDTPGLIQKPRHKLDEFMVETAVSTFADADILLWLVDASEPPGPETAAIAAQLNALPDEVTLLLALNKADLIQPAEALARTAAYRELVPANTPWILFSAAAERGVDELLSMLIAALPEGPRYYPIDQVTETYLRDMAAEFIREQVMLQLRHEIPYGTAVEILEFKERANGTTYISANIHVERDTHKRIIIGKKGAQLRKIGTAARQEIAQLVEANVFLELWVKVTPKWRRKEAGLKRFGYKPK